MLNFHMQKERSNMIMKFKGKFTFKKFGVKNSRTHTALFKVKITNFELDIVYLLPLNISQMEKLNNQTTKN